MSEENSIDIAIKEILEQSKAQVKTMAAEAVLEQIKQNIKWAVERGIDDVIKEFVKTEIAPAAKEMLVEQKQVIIDGLRGGIIATGAAISKALLAQIEKKLASDWDRRQIIEAVFK